MLYKDKIVSFWTDFYKTNKDVIFIGYNTVYGSRMYGTLDNIPKDSCIETPVAENLMVGLGMGMAIEGFLPVVCFERHDFLLIALDAMVNHVDKLSYMSGDKVKVPMVIRTIIGSKSPIDPGIQHNNDYTDILEKLVKFTPVYELDISYCNDWTSDIRGLLTESNSGAIITIELKDQYNTQIAEYVQ